MTTVAVRPKNDSQSAPQAAADPLQDGLTDPLTNDAKSNERGKEGTEAGALAWSDAMGEFVGGKLYGAIAGQLSEAKLEGLAVKVVESGVGAFQKWLAEQATTPDAAQATEKLAAELKKGLGPMAKELMDSDGGGWANKIGEFTDNNPWVIASAAVAAAVTYVVTNQKIPALKAPIKLGSAGKLTMAATLGGGIMDLFKGDVFLKEMSASYASKDGALKADVTQKNDGSGGVEQSANVLYKNDDKYAKLYGNRKMADGNVTGGKYGAEIGHKNDKSSSYLRGEHLLDQNVSTLGIGGSLTNEENGLTMSGDAMMGTDGRYSASGKLNKQLNDNLSLSALGSASHMPGGDTKYGGQVGLDYKKGNFSAGGFVGQDVINGKRETKAGVGLKWSF